KKPRLSASDRNRPDSKAIAQNWDPYHTAIIADHRHRAEHVVGIRVDVRNLNKSSFEYRASGRASSAWRCRIGSSVHLQHLGGETVVRDEVKKLAVEPIYEAELTPAEPPCALGNHVEHRLDVTPRSADHLEHVGSSDLLLTRLFQFTGE